MKSDATRLERTAAYLASEKLAALVGFNNGQNSFLDSNVVFVLSGVRPVGDAAILVEADGRSTLIVTPAWDGTRAAEISYTTRTVASDDLATALAGVLRERRIAPAQTVTVALPTLGSGLVRRLDGLFDGARSSDNFARELARIRTAEELACAEKATWIAERGYERLLEVARPGIREFELAAELYCHMKKLGAEDNFLLMSASQHNQAVRAAGRRVLEIGDIILGEITPCYRGQFVQICRTAVIGEPQPILREKFAVLQDAMHRGQEAALPGRTVRQVAQAIDDGFRAAGYADYCKPPFMRVRGHGLGITSDRPGDLTTTSEVTLEEGMVFGMHPNQYIPDTGYLMCGEPVVITPAGARSLSARDAVLDFIPA
jgi:Xaa-Pro dipeptidase